ncbi:hypothetical protein V1517DRAFT_326633 [Lipomyces orientalis]|uniref:Uncharacterized protein n=1 Tax=Lipomyces orientalis TaxID=1233043 RepID=A0ACC3TJQ2_9ASCO
MLHGTRCFIYRGRGGSLPDASASYDPDDGDQLSFNWFHYEDMTATQWIVENEVSAVTIEPIDAAKCGSIVRITLPPSEKCAVDRSTRHPIG